jgi:hypothetical protein
MQYVCIKRGTFCLRDMDSSFLWNIGSAFQNNMVLQAKSQEERKSLMNFQR